MIKLFDLTIGNEETVDVVVDDAMMLSKEEMLQSTIDQLSIESLINDTQDVIYTAREAGCDLERALSIATLAIENNDVTTRDVLNLKNAINSTQIAVGLDVTLEEISVESISDPKESLLLSIEEGRGILTKIIGAINKTFARYNNIALKYIGKFDTLMSSMFTNLAKRKKVLEELKKEGREITDKTIADDTLFKWNGFALMGAVGIGKMKDPADGINEMIKLYGNPSFVTDTCDKILSLVRDDKKLKPLYKNPEAMKAIERNLGKKIKNFFCKSSKDDRMMIGATYNNVFLLERCKALHITSKMNPWSYSVLTFKLPTIDQLGTPASFDTPQYKDMIKLIDDGIKVTKNQKKVVDDIHNMLKIGSDTIEKIDNSANWENSNIYGVMPLILLVLSKTYAEIPNMVDGLAGIYIKELKKAKAK